MCEYSGPKPTGPAAATAAAGIPIPILGGVDEYQLDTNVRKVLGQTRGRKNRGCWWVVSVLEGDLDADERVKRVGTSLRVKPMVAVA